MKRFLYVLPLVVAGCIPMHKNGQTYHLVLGVGVFKTEKTNSVDVVKAQVLGIYTGDRRFSAGWSHVVTASIPTNSNNIIEIK